MSITLTEILDRLRSPHAHRVYVAKEYTKADLADDLERLAAEGRTFGQTIGGKGPASGNPFNKRIPID